MTDERYREKARAKYAKEGECEIDGNAQISRGDEPGAYVAAWVWVYSDAHDNPEPTDCDEGGSEDDEDQGPARCVVHTKECCDQDGICPICRQDEVITALLKAIGDLGTQDVYTDSGEYQNRAAAARNLAHLCNRIIGGERVTVADVEDITTTAHEVEANND